MAVQIIPGEDAFHNAKRNPAAHWPTRLTAENRLEPLCKPAFAPSFQMVYGEKVFTIGSCFARHVEKALVARGFDVVTTKVLDADFDFARFGMSILNNYGVPSIYNELDWALHGDNAFKEEDNFFEIVPDRFMDIHLTYLLRPAILDTIRRRRAAITGIVRQVVHCPTVVMTLGLVEVWHDGQTGRYLNMPPAKVLLDRFPGRFALHVLDYETALSFLRRIISLLKDKAQVKQNVVLTVSPVPLIATFTNNDVLVANSYSKSLLRTIVEVVVNENDHVDYFPSYESVTLSDRAAAWKEDLHHVETSLISLNVERMVRGYVEGVASMASGSDVALAVAEAKELIDAKDFVAALGRLEHVADRLCQAEDLILYAKLLARLNRPQEAIAVFDRVPRGEGGWGREIDEAEVLLSLGHVDDVLRRALDLTKEHNQRPQPWRLLAQVRFERQEYADAVVATRAWSQRSKRSNEPMRFLAKVYQRQQKPDAAEAAFREAIEREAHRPALLLDYAEFLIDQKRFEDARTTLDGVVPTNRANEARLESLRLFAL